MDKLKEPGTATTIAALSMIASLGNGYYSYKEHEHVKKEFESTNEKVDNIDKIMRVNNRKINAEFENIKNNLNTSVSQRDLMEIEIKIDALLQIMAEKDNTIINQYKAKMHDIKQGQQIPYQNRNYTVDSYYNDGIKAQPKYYPPMQNNITQRNPIFDNKVDDDILIHSINNQIGHN